MNHSPYHRWFFLLVLFLGFSGPAEAQPANDTCATAEALGPCPITSILGDNTDATPPAGTPDPELPIGTPSCHWITEPEEIHNNLWYTFEATLSQVFVTTCPTETIGGGTDFSDSILALYEGECESLLELACNEDVCSTGAGGLWLAELCYDGLTQGQTYTIMMGNTGGWVGSTPGAFQMNVACPCPEPPPNDACANAIAVFGGFNATDNRFASTDGLPHGQGCTPLPLADVWYRYTATFSGDAVFSMCQGTTYDAVMGIYDDNGNCPPTTQDLVACDDDTCQAGGPPHLVIEIVQGQDYLIRVGGFESIPGSGEAAQGEGMLAIGAPGCGNGIIEEGELCDPPGAGCNDQCQFITDSVCSLVPIQESLPDNLAFVSDLDDGQTVADSFQANENATITEICWWGYYLDLAGPDDDCGPGPGDDFTITYFDTVDGVPGNQLAQFSVTATKVVSGGFAVGLLPRQIFEYTASHAEVPVTEGECYWVEIVNNLPGDCSWLWQTAPVGAGDGVAVIDGTLTGYTQDDITDDDLTLALNIDAGPCSGGCCIPSSPVTCQDISAAADCAGLGGDFVLGTDCASFVTCGVGACCAPDGSCVEGFEENCDGTFSLGVSCADIICDVFDDCSWDNGIIEGDTTDSRSQFAPGAFFAEAADNFNFQAMSDGVCVINEIVVSIQHAFDNNCFDLCQCPNGEFYQQGVAADVCGTGNPSDCVNVTRGLCSDNTFCWVENTDPDECGGLGAADCTPYPCTNTPDDYLNVWVTIYDDGGAGPLGYPEHETNVACTVNADCEALDGGQGETECVGNLCVDTDGNPVVVPLGTHFAADQVVVVPPANFTWEEIETDRFLVTLDLSSFDVEVDENERKWIAIAPEVPPEGGFFYGTFLEDSANFDGVNSQQVFESGGIFPFTENPWDLAFSITGGEGVGTGGIRGDFDYNFIFSGLVDGLGILNFFFIPGSPGTPCEDAADADGNGSLNGLVDGLQILNIAFIPGVPPPPPPFPDCGPLPDVLGCDAAVPCP